MAPTNYSTQRMTKEEVRKHLDFLMKNGADIHVSSHASERLKERGILSETIRNVLESRSARVENGEPKNGRFSYRVETSNIGVVIAFDEPGHAIMVVTVYDR